MLMETLVLWEVSRKQDYIFRSNKLKENKGASNIIEKVIEELPTTINLNYEKNLVYNGGGNSLYKFNDKDEAKDFIKKVSEKILREFPGLEVFMVLEEYAPGKITLAVDKLYEKLAMKKNERRHSGVQMSFGIERRCQSTKLPACDDKDKYGEQRYISNEILRKIDYSDKSSPKFNRLLPVEEGIKEVLDLVEGEKSYIAIVHIDGNKMGKRFAEIKKYFESLENKDSDKDNEYLDALREFSKGVKEAYEDAFRYMCKVVLDNSEKLKDDTKIKEGKFPIIPIIIAGDDVTFITNGKIALECARVFLEYLSKKEINIYKDKKVKLNACAGIAIVKKTYPFFRAYRLAEELCNNAKKQILKDYPSGKEDFSLIDWHIEQQEIIGNIEEIREKLYMSNDGKELYMRPLYVNNNSQWNNYKNFKEALFNITKRKASDGGASPKPLARSKLKKLMKILKEGEKETEIYIESNKLSGYFSRLEGTNTGDYCFCNNKCMYYDAIEFVDMFIELDEGR